MNGQSQRSRLPSAVAATSISLVALAALPEAITQDSTATAAPLVPSIGRSYDPVVTLNGCTLPWRMNGEVEEFHLVAEPVVREMAPGFESRMAARKTLAKEGMTMPVVTQEMAFVCKVASRVIFIDVCGRIVEDWAKENQFFNHPENRQPLPKEFLEKILAH